MKYSVLIALINLVFGRLTAQPDSAFLKTLKDVIREIQPESTIYYSDLPFEDFENGFKDTKRKIYFYFDPKEHIHLSHKEKVEIISGLKAAQNSSLPDSLIINSKRIPRDSLENYTYKLNLRAAYSIATVTEAKYALYVRRFWGFSFSLPIYLRNKSLMAFYFSYYDNSGGASWITVRKKDGEKWIRIGGLSLGAW
ncbi:MAG: hypothetical protein C5B52_16630 [Bacteroidetes bacterium]|nr:MAG: hypothetical protein C5B52_16630 [Bacteroidota bacterium]